MFVSQNIIKKLINYLIIINLIVSYLLLSGCSPSIHEWQAKGDDLTVIKDASKIPVLQKDVYCHVTAQYLETTTQLLKEREFQSITNKQAMLWCGNFQPPGDATLKPYLVRGVVYRYPSYTIVRFDQNTGELINHHATWNGENILGTWALSTPYPWPLVIYLPSPPKTVFPTAVLGGDWIFYGRDFKTLDTRSFVRDPNEHSLEKQN
jgi:hypothetical protein